MKKFLFGFGFALIALASAKAASAATLSVSPTSGSYTAGQIFNVDINLDTQGAAVDGVDLYFLRYNPAILEVQDANSSVSGVQITAGTLLTQTLTNTVDVANGKITFSQVTTGGSSYTGSGKLASVSFKALANGTSGLAFDFTPGSTSDTNVAGGGVDKLTSVTNGSYTVTGGTTPPPTPTPTPTPTPPPPPTQTNNLPVGNFDQIANGVVSGWSYDPDDSSSSNTVQIFFNGAAGTGTLVGSFPTDQLRADVNSVKGILGNHGFAFTIPDNYKDGQTHSVYVYGIDLEDSSQSTLLSGSPKSFTLSLTTPTPTPTPTPTLNIPEDGTLIKDSSSPAIYIVEYGKKRPFATWDAFVGAGFKSSQIQVMDTSAIPLGDGVFTKDQRHTRGVVVVINGTVYYLGALTKYAFPSEAVFYSWGHTFDQVVAGNSYDTTIPDGPIVTLKGS